MPENFDLEDFLPYRLNRAAEAASLGFQGIYKARYGMLRTEWRVLFHLGRYGRMTAREICSLGGLHKTKVSRAVKALEAKRFVLRRTEDADRRREALSLTRSGEEAYSHLAAEARRYDALLARDFTPDELATLRRCLARITG